MSASAEEQSCLKRVHTHREGQRQTRNESLDKVVTEMTLCTLFWLGLVAIVIEKPVLALPQFPSTSTTVVLILTLIYLWCFHAASPAFYLCDAKLQ